MTAIGKYEFFSGVVASLLTAPQVMRACVYAYATRVSATSRIPTRLVQHSKAYTHKEKEISTLSSQSDNDWTIKPENDEKCMNMQIGKISCKEKIKSAVCYF